MEPPGAPIPSNQIYGNYTATVDEVLEVEIETTVDVTTIKVALGGVIDERLDEIANKTGVDVSALSGTLVLADGTVAFPVIDTDGNDVRKHVSVEDVEDYHILRVKAGKLMPHDARNVMMNQAARVFDDESAERPSA